MGFITKMLFDKVNWDNVKYFTADEFNCPKKMSRELLRRLDLARLHASYIGKDQTPFVITSDYRKGDPKSHGKGLAVDIRCHDSHTRWKIIYGLIQANFGRIGIYDRHIHADIDTSRPSMVAWLGKSQ